MLQLKQCITLCGPCVLTESVIHFVNGNCYKADSGRSSERQDMNMYTLDAKTSRAAANAAKSSSEWERVILTENICDKSYCSALLDLNQCEPEHSFEGSVSGTTIKVCFIYELM